MAFTGFQRVPFGHTVGILRQLRELFSAARGTDDAATVSTPLTLSTDPAGSPAADTLYKANICKAWINFDGTGTISIRDSFNVSSIDDDGTGNYTVNWDTDFANTNYCAVVSQAVGVSGGDGDAGADTYTVGSVGILTYSASSTLFDSNIICVAAFGAQ